ncbi:Protein CBR-HMG-20 [Caenorhabditis briggsae]|uniref:HMG box domain-containing protein n=2 Tax=Caenorhabditis briggsae TaxID=6238 RepID=A0AAE9DX79_CAEBR|nr:Protein CBR-HMG-20 [Caenorhabditis briggsae]ULU14515.1 hypothetical protein L3Y34_016767 [Caenorhabditis briggsae]CAP28497.2 Protein CBR-HMG-20 [Caenorhabditis briggsae]
MRSKRSDSTSGTSSSSKAADIPTLDAEPDEPDALMEEEMNRTPEENKNPSCRQTVRVVVEKDGSFSPPPALSPAYSVQGEDMEQDKNEEDKIGKEIKEEVVDDHEMDDEEKTPKKDEKKSLEEKKPKMKYKKRAEKDKDAVPFIDPNAPKRNRSAYVLFIVHRRASYSKATMSQRDINISLAADWQKLSADERVPFHQKAEEEKKKYIELMEEYKKTDLHKEFQTKRSKYRRIQQASANNRKRKHGDDSDDDGNEPGVQMSFPKPTAFCPLLNKEDSSSSALQYTGPIFTPEFMSYNKSRDSYRRQLAVERSNLEHELDALYDYDIDVRIQKQEDRIKSLDDKIEETMKKVKAMFDGVSGVKDTFTSIDSLSEWLTSLSRLGANNPTKKAVKEAIHKNGKAIVALRK